MASNHGKFISANLMNKELEMFISLDNEWLSYADGDVQSYTMIVATPVAYHEESGVLTFQNDLGHTFYMGEDFIQAFWETSSEFNLRENVTSTIRSGRPYTKKKNRDIL